MKCKAHGNPTYKLSGTSTGFCSAVVISAMKSLPTNLRFMNECKDDSEFLRVNVFVFRFEFLIQLK